ncbi:MAG: DUF411 domain-containing protein [bacterium]|nr:DUF411 domain-containing protein [bacterium]
MKSSNIFWIVLSILFLGGIAGTFLQKNVAISPVMAETKAVVFQDPSCGCCGVYAEYLQRAGVLVERNKTSNMGAIKTEYGIPYELSSCHTTVVGGYVVEGHIPLEAIEKLLEEKPNILGIAMPGMPSGSPGMPGPKTETWTIYALERDGSSSIFLEL